MVGWKFGGMTRNGLPAGPSEMAYGSRRSWLTQKENLKDATLSGCHVEWRLKRALAQDVVHRRIILDIDSSESPCAWRSRRKQP